MRMVTCMRICGCAAVVDGLECLHTSSYRVQGFYHGMVEDFSPLAEGLPFTYPCTTTLLGFPDQCFRWIFLQMPLTKLPGLPFQVRRHAYHTLQARVDHLGMELA